MTWSCFYQQVPRLQAKRDSRLHLLFSSTCHGQTTDQKTVCIYYSVLPVMVRLQIKRQNVLVELISPQEIVVHCLDDPVCGRKRN